MDPMAIVYAETLPRNTVRLLPYPQFDEPGKAPFKDIVKAYFHLLYLSIFTPKRPYYLLKKIYTGLPVYETLIRQKGYTTVGMNSLSYDVIMNMLYKEKCIEDADIKVYLDLLIPTMMKNIPKTINQGDRKLPFVGFTLKGDMHVDHNNMHVVIDHALITDLTNKGYTPILKWLYYFISKLSKKELEEWYRYRLTDVSSPLVPSLLEAFSKEERITTTLVNMLVQTLKIQQILGIDDMNNYWGEDVVDPYIDFPVHPEKPEKKNALSPPKNESYNEFIPVQYSFVCKTMWGRFLYDGTPQIRLDDNSPRMQEIISTFLKKLDPATRTPLVKAFEYIGILRVHGTESLTSHDYGYFPTIFGNEAGLNLPIDATSNDEDPTQSDPSTDPEMSSPADDKPQQQGNNPSASVQSDDLPELQPDTNLDPNNSMGNANDPQFAQGSTLDQSANGPLAPCSGEQVPLSQAANSYLYRQAVAALNSKLNEEDSNLVSPQTRAVLSTWCRQCLWLYPVQQTQQIVSKLGLEKHLTAFNRIFQGNNDS